MPRKPRYTVGTAAGPVAAPDSQTQATPHTDGTHDTGANTSSAQRRARVPPPPHSDNGGRQSRVNARPFRPPRNEARLASSSDIRDAGTPATNKKRLDLHEVVDDHSEDEDYDPDMDEVESFDDHVDDLFAAREVERQGNANGKKKDTDYWVVDVIENGVTYCMELTVKEALAIPPGKKIVLNHNRELQQVGQAAGLLSGFLGTLASDFQQLPISEKSWKTMSKASKEHAFDQFKVIFSISFIKQGVTNA
ncbi:uncharacterized protein [Arachis hypogaea]|uniref:uncharacterized protein n=1 Tax=Arachis hypogaea TaxID=3818 RepID=UPI003B20C2E6